MSRKIIIKNLKNNLIKILFILFFLKINPCVAKETRTLDYNNIKVFLEGNFIQGGLVKGKIDSNISVRFKGRILRKTTKGLFVICFGRGHPKMANLSIKINQNWISKTARLCADVDEEEHREQHTRHGRGHHLGDHAESESD